MPLDPFLAPLMPMPALPETIDDFPAWRAEAAAGAGALIQQLVEPAPDGVDIVEVTLPVDGGTIALKVYRPHGVTGLLPAHLYIHGGGWVAGDISDQFIDITCAERAAGAQCVTVAVNYRKAPEHPFPTGLNDCDAALRWMVDEASTLGIDPERIAVGGGSAGGNLAAALCLKTRDENGPSILFQLLEVPALDLTLSLPSHTDPELGTGYALHTVDTVRMIDWYLQGQDRSDPFVSPLLASDLSGLPPAHLMAAEYDILRDDAAAYAARLNEAGVAATATLQPGHVHGSSAFTKVMPSARAWRDEAIQALADAFAGK